MRRLAEHSHETGASQTWYVSFVGDSTIRQQAVSLCCLLSAGGRASGSFRVEVDRSVRHGKLRCNILGGAAAEKSDAIGVVTFRRTYRMDTLSPSRPSEINPRLPLPLQVALSWGRPPPQVLVVGPGGWEYEEGCADRHSLNDALCNEQVGNSHLQRRPWVLSDFAKRWALVLAALNSRFADSAARAATLVVVRTPTPRDFEPVDVMQGGGCTREEPMRPSELNEGKRAQAQSMRFAELSKIAITAALVAERAPWVQMLDAYAISRLRADSHLGMTRSSGSRCSFTGLEPPCYDCVHYCLPGVPDVFNGRLLQLVEHKARTLAMLRLNGEGHRSQSSAREVLARWNPWWYGEEPLVQRVSDALALQLRPGRGSEPTRLRCSVAETVGTSISVRVANATTRPLVLGVCSRAANPG
eukprot:1045475-Prymnesium_polylepis.1